MPFNAGRCPGHDDRPDGSNNGFGWKLNQVLGAQIVSVPMSVPFDRANRTFVSVMAGLAVVFVVMMVLLNLLLHFVIIRPVRNISARATEVSMGNMDAPEVVVRGKDEIASLAESFNRMRRSLANALKLLGERTAGMSGEPKFIGRYAIESPLGRGAMGMIYRAHDPDIDRKVAIKLIRADLLDGEIAPASSPLPARGAACAPPIPYRRHL